MRAGLSILGKERITQRAAAERITSFLAALPTAMDIRPKQKTSRAGKDSSAGIKKTPGVRKRRRFRAKGLSALSLRGLGFGLADETFLDAGSLAGAFAQVVELGAADVAVALHFDAGDGQ